MRDEVHRRRFAEFLERLARDEDPPGAWGSLVVTHYHDEPLEDIRRRLVQLSLARNPSGPAAWTDDDRAQLRRWAEKLKDLGVP